MAAVANQPPQPTPQALAVASFLKSQDLKSRTCILNGQRKDLFKVKRALRALQSETYAKAAAKNKNLPPVTSRAQAEDVFRLMPMNLLALRVSKIDPAAAAQHHGHSHGDTGKKRIKGLWTVRIEQQQEIRDDVYYTWFYDGPQWQRTVMAVGVFIVLLGIVMFPLWPPTMRLGVWYLSIGALGLLALFFLMALFRLILFCITYFLVPPGLWLYPNLFEDVGFFDSFRPVWGWHKTKKPKGTKKAAKAAAGASPAGGDVASPPITTSSEKAPVTSSGPSARDLRPKVEDE